MKEVLGIDGKCLYFSKRLIGSRFGELNFVFWW